MDDRRESVLIDSRSAETVTLADGRICRVLAGLGPDGNAEEVLRIDEVGPMAVGGVVRVCHAITAADQQAATQTQQRGPC